MYQFMYSDSSWSSDSINFIYPSGAIKEIYGCIDGWMNEWIMDDEWVNGCLNESTFVHTAYVSKCMLEHIYGCVDDIWSYIYETLDLCAYSGSNNFIPHRLHSGWEGPERSLWLQPRYGEQNLAPVAVSVWVLMCCISSRTPLFFPCTACNSATVWSLTLPFVSFLFAPLLSAVLCRTVRGKHTAAFVIARIFFFSYLAPNSDSSACTRDGCSLERKRGKNKARNACCCSKAQFLIKCLMCAWGVRGAKVSKLQPTHQPPPTLSSTGAAGLQMYRRIIEEVTFNRYRRSQNLAGLMDGVVAQLAVG